MANKNARNGKLSQTEDVKESFSKGGDAETKSAKRSRGSRGRRRNTNSDSAASGNNATMNQMSTQSAVATNSLLFPMDSASMAAFGNMTTTPGQNNFINEFTRLYRTDDAADQPLELEVGNTNRRTASAMVLSVVPYFGDIHTSVDGFYTSPISMAAANLKQFVDTSFGTNTNYAPQDLIVYLMAVAAIYPWIAEIKRDLRLALTVTTNQFPQYLPHGLFQALHISDEAGNIAQGAGAMFTATHLREFTDRLNQLILAFNRLPMPPEIMAFSYNDDLFSEIYADSPDAATCQLYAFQNQYVWMYSEASSDHGAQLIPVQTTRPDRAVASVADKLMLLSEMIQAVSVLRTDSGAMLQNLFNAYGSRDTLQVPLLEYGAINPLVPIYHSGILTMIENAKVTNLNDVTITPITADANSNTVIGHVFVKPQDTSVAKCVWNLPLQFHVPAAQVTKEDIGWAMRMHPAFLTQKPIEWWDEGGQLHEESRLTADGFTGFAFLTNVKISAIQDDGNSHEYIYDMWRQPLDQFDYRYFYDFSSHPITYSSIWTIAEDKTTHTLWSYEAKRDVEVTFRQADIEMMWTYLTQTVWAANVNRNVTGSRIKG